MSTIALPPGFSMRPPALEDAQAVTDLITLCDKTHLGLTSYDLDALLTDWERPHFTLALDATVLVTSTGQIVGYTDVAQEELTMFISPNTYVLPAYYQPDIERILFRHSEARAQKYWTELQTNTPCICRTVSMFEERAHLLEQEGFTNIRTEWEMGMNMTEPPQAAKPFDDMIVRTFVAGQDEQRVYEVIETAFSEIPGGDQRSFEDWADIYIRSKDFDPSLYYVVEADSQIVGAALYRNYSTQGWLHQLAVLRPYRRRGIAIHLLQRGFAELYQRGQHYIGLHVNSQNPTSALHIYQQAGMHIVLRMDTYEKILS